MASLFFALEKGYGLHEHDIHQDNLVPINKSIWAFHIFYVISSDSTPVSKF
jgi:hypothetical protein